MQNDFLSERVKDKDIKWLERDADHLMSLSNKLVEGKRDFLIPTTAVSATIIAGLLIFMTNTNNYDWRFVIGAVLFAVTAIFSHTYLTILLSLESRKLDHELNLRKGTLNNYKEKMRQGITDPKIYSGVLALVPDERDKLKYTYKLLEYFSKERFFVFPNLLFIFAFLWLFFAFLCRIIW